ASASAPGFSRNQQRRWWTVATGAEGSVLQAADALAVIAAVLLDPSQAAIAVGRLVGGELIGAGLLARLVQILLAGVFRRDRRREYRGRILLTAFVTAEVDPFAALELARDFGLQVFHRTGGDRQRGLRRRSTDRGARRCRRRLHRRWARLGIGGWRRDGAWRRRGRRLCLRDDEGRRKAGRYRRNQLRKNHQCRPGTMLKSSHGSNPVQRPEPIIP